MLRSIAATFACFLALIILHSPAETSNSLGLQAHRTPYDTRYREVEDYLVSSQYASADLGSPSFSTQISRVRRYMDLARRFTFLPEPMLPSGRQMDHWQLPEETEALGTGDCEDLAIWLYSKLLGEGLSNIRFTVGLAGPAENQSMHAWVTWYERGETYILDPSRQGGVFGPGQPGSISYQPYYSYYFNQRWHHR